MNQTDQQAQSQPTQLSEEETAEVLENATSLLVESALARFLVTLEEPALTNFEAFLEKHKDAPDLVELIVAQYPIFGEYVEEAAEALNEKAQAITGS
jgi:hypothetical protein